MSNNTKDLLAIVTGVLVAFALIVVFLVVSSNARQNEKMEQRRRFQECLAHKVEPARCYEWFVANE